VTVVFGGVPVAPTARLRRRLAEGRPHLVVAADSGAATALAFGLVPDIVVGDMDSLSPALIADLERRKVAIERHPRDKDATDGELAVEWALATRPDAAVLLVGFLGGPRLDQAAANLQLLAALPSGVTVLDELNEGRLVRSGEELTWVAEPDELVSLVSLAGDARGVTTEGLRWQLDNSTLPLGATRGVSNEPAGGGVRVRLREGILLVTRHFPNG
jgi:thiamine pyrophosphokinase